MNNKIIPLGDNVLVRMIKPEKTTQGGIVLPNTAAEDRPQEGQVIARGDGKKIDQNIKEGAKVLFAKYSGTEVKIDKEDCLILKGEDILAVIK